MRIPNVLRGTITWRTVDKQFNKGEEGPSLYNIGLKVTDMNSGAYVELELSSQEHTRREGEREGEADRTRIEPETEHRPLYTEYCHH